ncbi:MAG TPA: hypothetical protein ENJ37_10285 [Deltaproteobacteria bacterium]|nr:hypothetical protein [Deltaproteobacteria bacterium]
MVKVVGVRFKKACRIYEFDANGIELERGDRVIVEVDRGMGFATIVREPVEKDGRKIKRPLKKVIRKADSVDIERLDFIREREVEAFRLCQKKIERYGLPMKLTRVEYLFDSSKAIFYFTSESRVDFRELVRDLASNLHIRIEMRQIGVRDESKMLGGIGPCGLELCCSTFLDDFEPVTVKMAKEQNMALNPAKISGVCGRLMCCLGFEHAMYKKAKGRQGKGRGCGRQAGRCGGQSGSRGGAGKRTERG